MTDAEVKIKSFYITSLYEILSGESLNVSECVIKDFEAEELYEECQGIKMALELAKRSTILELEEEYTKELIEQHGKQINT